MDIFAPGVVVRRNNGDVQFGLTPRSPGTLRWRLPHFYNPETITWYTLDELALRAGVSVGVMGKRLKAKWNCDQLRQPAGYEHVVQAQREGITVEGRHLSIAEAAQASGLSYTAVVARLKAGLTVHNGLLDPPLHAPRGPSRNGPNAHLRNDPPKKSALRDNAVGPDVSGFTDPAHPTGRVPTPATRLTIDGIDATMREHCIRLQVTVPMVQSRLRRGVPLAEAFDPRRRTRSDSGLPRKRRVDALGRDPELVQRRQHDYNEQLRANAARARQASVEYREHDKQLRDERIAEKFAADRERAAAARAAGNGAAERQTAELNAAMAADDFSWIVGAPEPAPADSPATD